MDTIILIGQRHHKVCSPAAYARLGDEQYRPALQTINRDPAVRQLLDRALSWFANEQQNVKHATQRARYLMGEEGLHGLPTWWPFTIEDSLLPQDAHQAMKDLLRTGPSESDRKAHAKLVMLRQHLALPEFGAFPPDVRALILSTIQGAFDEDKPLNRWLLISGRNLSTVPEAAWRELFSYLRPMVKLTFENTLLNQVPPGVEMLSNLKELNLNANYIMAIPREIQFLSALKSLELLNNGLTEDKLSSLSALKTCTFYLDGMPDLPPRHNRAYTAADIEHMLDQRAHGLLSRRTTLDSGTSIP